MEIFNQNLFQKLANDDDDGDGFLTLQEFFKMINQRYQYSSNDDNYSFDPLNQPNDHRQGFQGYENNAGYSQPNRPAHRDSNW